jgi:hypothetical protein
VCLKNTNKIMTEKEKKREREDERRKNKEAKRRMIEREK